MTFIVLFHSTLATLFLILILLEYNSLALVNKSVLQVVDLYSGSSNSSPVPTSSTSLSAPLTVQGRDFSDWRFKSFVRFTALGSSQARGARHNHLRGGIELPNRVQTYSKESNP